MINEDSDSDPNSLLKFLASEDAPLQQDSAIMFQDPDEQIIGGTVERELSLGRPDLDVGRILGEIAGRESRPLVGVDIRRRDDIDQPARRPKESSSRTSTRASTYIAVSSTTWRAAS